MVEQAKASQCPNLSPEALFRTPRLIIHEPIRGLSFQPGSKRSAPPLLEFELCACECLVYLILMLFSAPSLVSHEADLNDLEIGFTYLVRFYLGC